MDWYKYCNMLLLPGMLQHHSLTIQTAQTQLTVILGKKVLYFFDLKRKKRFSNIC